MKVIKDKYDFGGILALLNPKQCSEVSIALQSQIKKIIRNYKDFKMVISILDPGRCEAVFQSLRGQLPLIIENSLQLAHILEYLDESKQKHVKLFKAMKNHIPQLIKNGYDFKKTMDFLTEAQRTEVHNLMKYNLASIIETVQDFNWLLKNLDKHQRAEAYEIVETRVLKLINCGCDFEVFCRLLPSDQRSAVYDDLGEDLIKLYKNCYDFQLALKHLNEDERNDQIKAILQSEDFELILKCIQPNHRLLRSIEPECLLNPVQRYVSTGRYQEDLMEGKNKWLLKTWKLYWQYKGQINSKNVSLIKSLHQLNYEMAGIFKRTNVTFNNPGSCDDDYLNPPRRTRRAMIKKILDSKEQRPDIFHVRYSDEIVKFMQDIR